MAVKIMMFYPLSLVVMPFEKARYSFPVFDYCDNEKDDQKNADRDPNR